MAHTKWMTNKMTNKMTSWTNQKRNQAKQSNTSSIYRNRVGGAAKAAPPPPIFSTLFYSSFHSLFMLCASLSFSFHVSLCSFFYKIINLAFYQTLDVSSVLEGYHMYIYICRKTLIQACWGRGCRFCPWGTRERAGPRWAPCRASS